MAKKILTFSLAYYPSFVSGAEAAVKEITDRIDSAEVEFHLITHLFDTSAPREERIDNVTVYRVGFGNAYLSKILYIPLAALKARSLHTAHQFDGMWAMMTYMLMPTVLARWLGVRVPYVLTLQDGDPYEKVFGRWFIRPLTPLLDYGFRSAATIQAISHYLATWPGRRGYAGEVIVVPNGANPANLRDDYPQDEAQRIKREFGKQEGDIYLLLIARLVHQKAQNDIIRALAMLPENVKLILGGTGPDEQMLKGLATSEGVEDRVWFLGPIERTDVPKYRNRIVADIFVHPSRSEGLALAGLSAMAARLPMIATQEGGLADYVFDAERNPDKPTTAWAVDPDSPEKIAAAVEDILTHPEKVQRVTENARRMVEEEYDWDEIAKKMQTDVFAKLWN